MARIASIGALALGAWALAAPGAAAGAGGAVAPDTNGGSGGTEYGTPLAGVVVRPVASLFSVSPARVTAGAKPPRIALRIDEPGVRSVAARVVFWPLRGDGRVLRIDLGRVRTGRVVRPAWPSNAALAAGQYQVRVHAKDANGHNLRRRAHTSGRTTLVVRRAPAPPAPAVSPVLPPGPSGGGAGVVPGGTYPVRGAHTYGDRFGAAREGYSHQGQDVAAAEGTPIVAPVAGTISFTDYQAKAAGYYVVEHAADGRDFFFAHCQKDSVAVTAGQAVAQGAPLCNVGATGDASGAHLHFEIWPNGWRTTKDAQPIDPLPQLQAWEGH